MPKINVYLPDALADAVRDAQLPVSAICQSALERAVRDVESARATMTAPPDDMPAVGLLGRFTPRARAALTLADEQARAVPHDYIGTEHLLLGVLREGSNLALKVLAALEVEADDLDRELTASMAAPTAPTVARPPFTPLAKQVLETSAKEALQLGHNYIGCEHLLLGLVGVEDGLASQVLRRMGIEMRIARRAVVTALSGYVHAGAVKATSSTTTLDDIVRRLDAIEKRLP